MIIPVNVRIDQGLVKFNLNDVVLGKWQQQCSHQARHWEVHQALEQLLQSTHSEQHQLSLALASQLPPL